MQVFDDTVVCCDPLLEALKQGFVLNLHGLDNKGCVIYGGDFGDEVMTILYCPWCRRKIRQADQSGSR